MIPNNTDIVTLAGKPVSYLYLRETLGLPENAIVDGCHAVAIGSEDEIQLQRVFHFSRCLPFDGFSEKSFAKLAQNKLVLNNPHLIFDEHVVTDVVLKTVGFGPGQIKNFNKARSKYKEEGIDLQKLVQSIGILNCGESISREFAREFTGLEADYTGKTMAVVEELRDNSDRIQRRIQLLERNGYKINYPQEEKATEAADALVILTGSPKEFGYKTKAEFLSYYPNWKETKKFTEATYLITDDLSSTSSKMKKAEKAGMKIITYGQAQENY
jgi:NAD-dependent DNA ligase